MIIFYFLILQYTKTQVNVVIDLFCVFNFIEIGRLGCPWSCWKIRQTVNLKDKVFEANGFH